MSINRIDLLSVLASLCLAACTCGNSEPAATAAGGDGSGAGPLGIHLVAGNIGSPGSLNGVGIAARMDNPNGIASDGAGNLYIADGDNSTIRKIDSMGMVTTLAGTVGDFSFADGTGAAARFSDLLALATDGAGNLYVTDNNRIRKIVIATAEVTTLAGSGLQGATDAIGTAASFRTPGGIVFDGNGNLYVTDIFNHTIRKIVIATGQVSTYAGQATVVGGTDGNGAGARFNRPNSIAIDPSGNLYVTEWFGHTIRKISPLADVTTLAGSAGAIGSTDGIGAAARFREPWGVAYHAGLLYVAEQQNHTIRKIDVATAAVTTIAGAAGIVGNADGIGSAARFRYPQGIAVDGSGNLYIADTLNDTIRKMTPAGVTTTVAGAAWNNGSSDGIGAAAEFDGPLGVVADPAGNIYVSDTGNNTIRKIAPDGAVSTFAGTAFGTADGTGTAARFARPAGMVLAGDGNLYVADYLAHTIRKITLAAVVTTLAGAAGSSGATDAVGTAATFFSPRAIAADSAGNLYVADTQNHTIRKIVIATGAVTTFAGTTGVAGSMDASGTAARFNRPMGITADGAGYLHVVDSYNHTIRKIEIATANVTTLAGLAASSGSTDGIGAAARFQYPYGVTADGKGNLYVSDSENKTIRRIVLATGEVSTIAGVAGGLTGIQLGDLPGNLIYPYGVSYVSPNKLVVTTGNSVVAVDLP